MTRRWAINIIGYFEDQTGKYDRDAIIAILNRPEVADCFKPLHVTEIVVQSMEQKHSISSDKVSSKKLSQL